MLQHFCRSQRSRVAVTLTIVMAGLGLASGCTRNADGSKDKDESAKHNEPGVLATVFNTKTKVEVPAGETFTVALDHALSTKSNSPGDEVSGHLVNAMVSEGKVAVPAGASARGMITALEGSGRVEGRARMAMEITAIETADGWKDVTGTMTAGALVAPGTKKRDAAVIGGGAAAGAVLGEIIGDKPGLGAVIGGAAGTGVVLSTKGKEITLPAGTHVRFRLSGPLVVKVSARDQQAD
jgi:hypothetical protein